MQESGCVRASERTLEVEWRVLRGPFCLELGTPCRGKTCLDGAPLVVGSGAGVDLRVEDPTVSGRHCSVVATAEGVVVEDLGSRNGTFVGGARVRRAWLQGRDASFVIGRTTVTLREKRREEPEPSACVPELIGHSLAIRRVADVVHKLAPLSAPTLITGESGTGKDVVARALHRLGGRSGAYVPLNVGAIPEALADAELFGHCRGAFTGAIATRAGAFELAQHGTLFLDEVAELAASLQVKLLRIVEDGQLRPVGASKATRVSVRVVSATWADLDARVTEGRFRSDLLHRLSTVVIRLPPLRQRKCDISCLAVELLGRHESELGPKRLTSAALARLVDYAWPGNVRELGSVLYRAAVASTSESLDAVHIELPKPGVARARAEAPAAVDPLVLLERHAGNVSSAARAAGVPRSTFRSWLEKARDARG
jgi:DNA-binding NtrC family response regulator